MHLVDQIEGEYSMAYSIEGGVPWHTLGQPVPLGSDINTWAVLGHLLFNVIEQPVIYYVDGYRDQQIPMTFDSRKTLYRDDTMEPLEVVSAGYHVVQPIEVLEFYRDLVDNYGYVIETCGTLDGGKKVFALARMGKGVRIMGQDLVMPYALLCTSYDKSLSTTFKPTTIRAVCWNTLSWAYAKDYMQAIRIPHSKKFNPDQVKIDAGLYEEGFNEMADDMNKMANTRVTKDQAVKFFLSLYHDLEKEEELEITPAEEKAMNTMIQLATNGRGANLESSKGTVWGLLNAVTEFVDHEAASRSTNNRFKSSQFGAGNVLKGTALNQAEELIAKAA